MSTRKRYVVRSCVGKPSNSLLDELIEFIWKLIHLINPVYGSFTGFNFNGSNSAGTVALWTRLFIISYSACRSSTNLAFSIKNPIEGSDWFVQGTLTKGLDLCATMKVQQQGVTSSSARAADKKLWHTGVIFIVIELHPTKCGNDMWNWASTAASLLYGVCFRLCRKGVNLVLVRTSSVKSGCQSHLCRI